MKGGRGWQRRHAVVKYALSIKVTSDILSAVCGNKKSGAADITPQHRTFANMNMIMIRMVLQTLFDFRDTWLALQPLQLLQLWLTSDISYPWSSYYLE